MADRAPDLPQADPLIRSTEVIVIGCSAGGIKALTTLLSPLGEDYPIPLIIVQHASADSGNYRAEHISSFCKVPVTEIADQVEITAPGAFVAPGGYHVLIENDHSFSLCVSERVSYARPSIDVLFQSASEVYDSKIQAILLTGANRDGAAGALLIHHQGGVVLVQDPTTAEVAIMPQAAIDCDAADAVMNVEDLATHLQRLGQYHAG